MVSILSSNRSVRWRVWSQRNSRASACTILSKVSNTIGNMSVARLRMESIDSPPCDGVIIVHMDADGRLIRYGFSTRNYTFVLIDLPNTACNK